jgi:hypothetical protein
MEKLVLKIGLTNARNAGTLARTAPKRSSLL